MPTPRRSPTSMARLEGKVDDLAIEVEKNGKRVERLDLNGSAAALHRLAMNADKLLRLVEFSDYIVAAVEHQREREIVNKWLKRTLNPLASKGGALIWLVISAAIFAYIARFFH